MLLKDKLFLVTGVVSQRSISYSITDEILKNGGKVILLIHPKVRSLVSRVITKLHSSVEDILDVDVLCEDDLEKLSKYLKDKEVSVSGLVHSIAYADSELISGNFLNARWEHVSNMLHISSYSLKSLSNILVPFLDKDASIVAMDFDSSISWPYYDWMGVAKSTLESIVRYLARYINQNSDTQVRVNAISAGPLVTLASKGIKGFNDYKNLWNERSLVQWDPDTDAINVAKSTVMLLSDYTLKITGEIVHVDSGVHSTGG